MFPRPDTSKEGFFGIDGLRIFMPAEAFETLVRELSTRCSEGNLGGGPDRAALPVRRSVDGH
jgi:hypothetical protein